MATQADPRIARPRRPVPNAPDTRTFRTSETLLQRASLAQSQLADDRSENPRQQLFEALQARYG